MARLISIEAEDFAGYRSFKLPLAEQGLVFIGGDNRDSSATNSNGACKSGIFKAIGWGLYGESIDGESGDKIIHRGQKRARVVHTIEDGSDVYEIVRERHKQSPKLTMTKNGHPIPASKADIQSQINTLIGTDWRGFKNTVLYGQGDRERFVYPTTRDSVRKEILHHIRRTGVFTLCFEEAKARRREVGRKRDQKKEDIRILTDRIDDCDLERLQQLVDQYEREREKRIAGLQKEINRLKEDKKRAVDSIDLNAMRKELSEVDAEIAECQNRISGADIDAKTASESHHKAGALVCKLEVELENIASSLELLSGDLCPTCTTPLTNDSVVAHRTALEGRQDDLGARLSRARKARAKAATARDLAQRRIDVMTNDYEGLVGRRAAIAARINSARIVKEQVGDIDDQINERSGWIREITSETNPHIDAHCETKEKIGKLKRDRKKARAELSCLEKQLSHLEFWVRGFGPKGIPSFALDAVMPFITQQANHYLRQLSDGDMSMNFSTQRELKSAAGEFRDEIDITWVIEGIENYPPSGGQWKKMEIATNLALMDLVAECDGSHIDLLCMDECLDGLDAEGRQRVVSLLHDLRSKRKNIFVISHDEDLAEVFERTIMAIKEDGVSRIEIAA